VKALVLILVSIFLVFSLGAQDLPPVVREAVDLELQGRLGEALDRYRAALSSEPVLLQDEGLVQPLTIQVFSKVAHLSVDLGYGEDAWDLAGRLLSVKNQRAAEAGTLIRLRLLRIQDRWTEALALFDEYATAWPLPPPGAPLLLEVQRVRTGSQKSVASIETLVRKNGGPAAWVLDGSVWLLPGPADAWSLKVQETVRLQIGAFKDWGNALTLIDMLREKGWTPFTDVRLTSGGDKLHVVYVISRQAAADRSRLEAQGLLTPP